jgi:hypothetical protein
MLADLLLVLGFSLISLALRGSGLPFLHRLGNLCVLLTSFLLGWRLTGHVTVGIACAGSWLLLPWVDIITRVRHIHMPTDRPLLPQAPPGSSRFPALAELTEEIECQGFEQIEDAGWDHDEQRQFVRLFIHPTDCIRASINLVENEHISFFYLTLCSYTPDGNLWCTWNYPFSSSLKPSPNWRIQRMRSANTFQEIYQAHQDWLSLLEAGPVIPLTSEPTQLTAEIVQELRAQVAHNLHCGVLLKSAEGQVRYSWRGCFFLWTQFLRDLLRA